uniref:Uncharacterized protein n=1 Tax=Anguilla anguilla TaxID=7936 RepID=A0A0E9QDM8_ANGAN
MLPLLSASPLKATPSDVCSLYPGFTAQTLPCVLAPSLFVSISPSSSFFPFLSFSLFILSLSLKYTSGNIHLDPKSDMHIHAQTHTQTHTHKHARRHTCTRTHTHTHTTGTYVSLKNVLSSH